MLKPGLNWLPVFLLCTITQKTRWCLDSSGQYSIVCNATVAFFGGRIGIEFAGILTSIEMAVGLSAGFTSLVTGALTLAAGPVGTAIGATLGVLFTTAAIAAFTYGVYEFSQTVAAGAGAIQGACSRS